MNHKNERIRKLWERGIQNPEALARKTGLPLARIHEGLQAMGLREKLMSDPKIQNPDHPSSCEVAVSEDGKVVINYQCSQPTCQKWGHLSFDVGQAVELIAVLQQALVQAHNQELHALAEREALKKTGN